MNYYSQCGQDRFLDQSIFRRKTGGVFVEIGADDGITYSNTYFFEQTRKWNGVCIEPRKEPFEKLVRNRKAYCENCCISEISGTKTFLEIKGYARQLSGLLDKYDYRHLQRIQKSAGQSAAESVRQISVRCETLNSIVSKYGINKIDYLSIDTEGGELDILESIDFSKIQIDVISVENNYNSRDFKKVMASKGYWLAERLSVDEIYINPIIFRSVIPKLITGRIWRKIIGGLYKMKNFLTQIL